MKLTIRTKGGPGSGHFGHRGRPGLVGGSLPYGVGQAPSSGFGHREDIPWDEDPVAFGFVNKGLTNIGDDSFLIVDPPERGRIKQEICVEIARRSGLSVSEVRDLIANWAKTSNGGDLRALLLQKDFAEELGLELSDWQLEEIEELLDTKYTALRHGLMQTTWGSYYVKPAWDSGVSDKEFREQIDEMVQKYVEDAFEIDMSRYNEYGGRLPVKMTIREAEFSLVEYSGKHPGNPEKYFRLYPEEDQRLFARAMYENTQDALATYGYKQDDYVRLFRGFDTGEGEQKHPAILPEDTEIGYYGNALESWSVSYDIGRDFGNTVIAMDVPVKNVIGTCKTGFGCLPEAEFVITTNVGKAGEQEAYVVYQQGYATAHITDEYDDKVIVQ